MIEDLAKLLDAVNAVDAAKLPASVANRLDALKLSLSKDVPAKDQADSRKARIDAMAAGLPAWAAAKVRAYTNA